MKCNFCVLLCVVSVSCLYLQVCAWRHRTCVPLEARAPLSAGEHFVGVNVTGFEEGIGARLIPVRVEALDL